MGDKGAILDEKQYLDRRAFSNTEFIKKIVFYKAIKCPYTKSTDNFFLKK